MESSIKSEIKRYEGTKYDGNVLYRNPWINVYNTMHANPIGTKFHISLERSKDNYLKALDIITLILTKNNISAFKYQLPTSEILELKNQNLIGKEVTIYINKIERENNDDFWIGENGLLNEITVTLNKHQIKSGPASLGDIPFTPYNYIDANTYIYIRNDRQVTNNYISIAQLEKLGFTIEESVKIGDSTLVNKAISQLPRQAKSAVKQEILKSLNNVQPLKEKDIISAYISNIIQSSDTMLFGEESEPHVHQPKLQDREDFFLAYFFELNNKALNERAGAIKDNPLIIDHFYPFLQEAAAVTANILNSIPELGKNIKVSEKTSQLQCEDYYIVKGKKKTKPEQYPILGNISPIIYYYFYKPFILYCLKNNIKSQEDFRKLLQDPNLMEIIGINPKDFVKEIVKCSLRKPTSQIEYLTPSYLEDLTESQIEELVHAELFKLPSSTNKLPTNLIAGAISAASAIIMMNLFQYFNFTATITSVVQNPLLSGAISSSLVGLGSGLTAFVTYAFFDISKPEIDLKKAGIGAILIFSSNTFISAMQELALHYLKKELQILVCVSSSIITAIADMIVLHYLMSIVSEQDRSQCIS